MELEPFLCGMQFSEGCCRLVHGGAFDAPVLLAGFEVVYMKEKFS